MATITDGQAPHSTMDSASSPHGSGQAPTTGVFDDVVEIRECRVAEANQLLAEGWQLQGVYSWSQRVEPKKPGEQGYVRRAVVYVMLSLP